MKYLVCQEIGGSLIPCAEFKYRTWDNDTFNTKKEAFRFVIHWVLPIGRAQIDEHYQEFPIDTLFNFHGVNMYIRKRNILGWVRHIFKINQLWWN